MKVTIWQEHSSNHSGGYTVVGRFADAESAREGWSTIRFIIQAIVGWYRNPRNAAHGTEDMTPTEIELQFAQQYEVEWNERIDWIASFFRTSDSHYSTQSEHVWQYNDLVIVDIPYGYLTFQNGAQFVELFKALGGVPYQQMLLIGLVNFGYSEIQFDIDCIAPSIDQAQFIHNVIQKHRARRGSAVPKRLTPWCDYHPMQVRDSSRQIDVEETRIRADSCIIDDDKVTIQGCKGQIFALPALVDWLNALGCVVAYTLHQR